MAYYDNNIGSEYNFDFLDNYIQSISGRKRTNPNQIVEDDDFYSEQDDEEQVAEQVDFIQDQQDEEYSNEKDLLSEEIENYLFDETQHNELMSVLNNYDDEEYPNYEGIPVTQGSNTTLRDKISNIESQGYYGAVNPNSTATGKYQFLWSKWGDSIMKITGVKSREEFLKNPQAQEKYYEFYEKNHLIPGVEKLKKKTGTKWDNDKLAKLIHYRGEKGALDYISGDLPDKPESYNMKISEYIGVKKQAGGQMESVPIYKSNNDTIIGVKIKDTRKINPATGKPFKIKEGKSVQVDPEVVKVIVAHAKSQGLDPNDALAIALQETNLGEGGDYNYGHVVGGASYFKQVDKKYPFLQDASNRFAAALVFALKDKKEYAKRLINKKVIPDKEEYILQSYNGYGKLFPSTEAEYHGGESSAFYEIPVTKDKPLDLKKNPAYGKTILSLRDELIKNNSLIQRIIKETPAFEYKEPEEWTDSYIENANNTKVAPIKIISKMKLGGVATTSEQQYIGLNDDSLDELFMPLQGINTIRGLDSGEPVYVEDEQGNSEILYGPNHITSMKGPVFEKRLNKRR